MANTVYISDLNPVKFIELDPVKPPQYLSVDQDDYWFTEALRTFETQTEYYQKWTSHDAIALQFESDFDPIQIDLINCNQTVIETFIAAKTLTNKVLTGFYAYQSIISLNGIPDGIYFLLLTMGGTKKMISEPMQVCSGEGTMLFEYANSRYHGDVVFETGIVFSFRVEAFKRLFEPHTERTAYKDQRLNPSILKAIPFRTWEILVGKDTGVPDWVGNRLNWIFSCDNVAVDGKSLAVFEDSKIEPIEFAPNYTMRRYAIRVQEGVNRTGKTIGVTVDQNKHFQAILSLDSTIFGDLYSQAGSNLIQISDVDG